MKRKSRPMTRLERFIGAAAWWETFHEIDVPALQAEIRERMSK